MKRTNSFVLFGRAFKNAKKDFWVSAQVLFYITIVLAVVFYIVESVAQPEEYGNPLNSFVWALTRYIGDPGHFSGNGPVTLTGRYVDTAIGILKILIFAVPAGLVANGFKKAMDDENKRIHMEEIREKMRKTFRRVQNKATQYRVVTRYKSVISLQAQKGLTEDDIISLVTMFDEFRLSNLATTQTFSEHPQDRLVVEMRPMDQKTVDGYDIVRTLYGIKINRQSNVTIVAPSSAGECCIGHIAYYLAQFGGFNYVSKEFETDVDEPISYYTIKDENAEQPLKDFISDIKALSDGKEKWVIYLISSDNVHDTHFHYIHKAKEGLGLPSTTTANESAIQSFYTQISDTLKENYQLASDLDEKYRPVAKKNIGFVVAGTEPKHNFFTIRVSYHVTTWVDQWTPIVVDMAKAMKQHFESGERTVFDEKNPIWKKQGYGFGENYVEE